MQLSSKTRSKLYGTIHNEITGARIKLNLNDKDDVMLAEVILKIWDKQKEALKLPNIL